MPSFRRCLFIGFKPRIWLYEIILENFMCVRNLHKAGGPYSHGKVKQSHCSEFLRYSPGNCSFKKDVKRQNTQTLQCSAFSSLHWMLAIFSFHRKLVSMYSKGTILRELMQLSSITQNNVIKQVLSGEQKTW